MRNNDVLPYLEDLVIFTQVVTSLSFTKAAQHLGLNPSAVSRSVSRLEKKLKVQLLIRTTRQLNLTEQGKLVYQHGLEMITAAQHAIHSSQELNEELTGKIKIYSPRALGKFLLHPIILKFIQTYPQIDITFQLDDKPIDLINENIDIEFRITDHPPLELMGRKILYIEQILCASEHYIKKHGVVEHPSDLMQHHCISLSPDMIDTRWQFKSGQKKIAVDIHPHYCVNNAEARLEAILAGIGIATVPQFIAQTLLARQEIRQVLVDWQLQTNYTGHVWMLYAPSKHLPNKIKVFRDFVLNALAQSQSL